MIRRLSIALVCLVVAGCVSSDQLEEIRVGIEDAKEEVLATAHSDDQRAQTFVELADKATEALEEIKEKQDAGVETATAVAGTAATFLPPPFNGLALTALSLWGAAATGRARSNRKTAKKIAKAVVTGTGPDGVLNLAEPGKKAELSNIMGPAGNALIAEAKGNFTTSPI